MISGKLSSSNAIFHIFLTRSLSVSMSLFFRYHTQNSNSERSMITTFYQQPFPTIDLDDQYALREQTLEDTEAFFRYYTDPEVGQYILATKPATLLEASKEVQYCRNLFYSKQGIYWTIAKKNDNRMIGAIGLYT